MDERREVCVLCKQEFDYTELCKHFEHFCGNPTEDWPGYRPCQEYCHKLEKIVKCGGMLGDCESDYNERGDVMEECVICSKSLTKEEFYNECGEPMCGECYEQMMVEGPVDAVITNMDIQVKDAEKFIKWLETCENVMRYSFRYDGVKFLKE